MIHWNKRRARRIFTFVAGAVILNVIFPTHIKIASAAAWNGEVAPVIAQTVAPAIVLAEPQGLPLTTPISLPKPQDAPAKKVMNVRASAYTSSVAECDSTPFITASGSHVHDGTIAMNGIPFGTRIRIPQYYGNKVFTVEDRMNARWGNSRIDIWMTTRNDAKQWGVRTVTVEIL